MKCAECEAFEKAHRMAGRHYVSMAELLEKTPNLNRTEFQKLKLQAKISRGIHRMTEETLRVHKAGHKKT